MSRQYFDFSSLIDDYSSDFTVVTHTGSGYDDAGDWQEGAEQKLTLTGAIIAFKESKVLRSEGAITSKDKRLFMQQALPDALLGAVVLHGGQKYGNVGTSIGTVAVAGGTGWFSIDVSSYIPSSGEFAVTLVCRDSYMTVDGTTAYIQLTA